VNCYPFIEAEKASNHNVKRACEQLLVSRSGYYADRTSGPSSREQRDAVLTGKIARIHDDSRQTYGSPRVQHELQAQGERCSRKRVARLMREADRHGRTPRRWRKTTIADPVAAQRPDLIGRDFGIDPAQPGQPDRRWCGDITYIRTAAHLSAILSNSPLQY
jgi:transposase InsO family protein